MRPASDRRPPAEPGSIRPVDRNTVLSYLWPLLLAVLTAPLGDKYRLLAQLVVQTWVRYPLVRLMVSAVFVIPALLLAVMFGFSSVTYREWTPAQLQTVEGRLTGYAYDSTGRFTMQLDSYRNPFIPPAWVASQFPVDRFTGEVTMGDQLRFGIDRDLAGELNTDKLLVAHTIESDRAVYLSFAQSSAGRREQFRGEAPGGALALALVAAFFVLTLVHLKTHNC